MRVGLVADDLTGACDSAAPFLAGRVLVGLWPQLPNGEAACLAVSTESRHAPAEVCRRRSREAAAHLLPLCDRLYAKLDSRLAGSPAAALAGMLEVWPGPCLVAPALPAEGRVTDGRRQRWPGGEADLAGLLAPLGGRVDVRDAASTDDLKAIAREVAARPEVLPAGSAGLAEALAPALGLGPPSRSWPASHRPLALVGTPAARQQARVAREAGFQVREPAAGEWTARDLDGFDALFLTGGETAARVLAGLGAHSLELLGELLPRVPVGRLLDGPRAGLVVALKSGSFGAPDAIARSLARLQSGA